MTGRALEIDFFGDDFISTQNIMQMTLAQVTQVTISEPNMMMTDSGFKSNIAVPFLVLLQFAAD